MSDALRRALRGLFQVTLVQILIQGYNAFAENNLTNEQYAFLVSFGTLLISFAQNMLEDANKIPSYLKYPQGQSPADEPAPH